ncbi:MAG: amidohydrolase, partial [Myxococcales bacterium]|nr:amidohydrolase [Myxococcales bacterium]
EAALGAPPEDYLGRASYPAGAVIAYGDDDVADLVAVVAPYVLAPEPPPMTPARTTMPAGALDATLPDGALVDMHLHPGDYAAIAPTGKAFITGNLPPFLQAYAPTLFSILSDPYAAHVGIREQTSLAGVDHAVLFAVYTQHTTGYFTNEQLEAVLTDPRNVAADGLPWAFGMASINFDDWQDDVAGERLEALRSYLVQRPDLFIGIKLAHAHQGVAFDDPVFQGVYQIAAETGVPVLLHTGFSPFPGTSTDPAFYDPQHLEAVISAYDGDHGLPKVDFVLSHVGQGDARAVAHAIELAETHANVWLELSALGRPLRIDADGNPSTSTEPQYPAVLDEILAHDLVSRTLWASDGPQYSGAVRSYLGVITDGMIAAGYSDAQIAAVRGGNFARLYLRRRGPQP